MVAAITRVDTAQRISIQAGINFREYLHPVVGEWVIMVWTSQAIATQSRKPIVPDDSWTTLRPFGTIGNGTASIGIYAKKYTNTQDLLRWQVETFEGANQCHALGFCGTGADIEHWVIGTPGIREQNATTTTAKAPSVTTLSDGMALTIAAERTLAEETPEQVTVTGSTKNFVRRDSSTMVVGASKTVEIGSVGEVVFGFPNPHATNGYAQTIVIPHANPTGGLDGYPLKIVSDTGTINASFKVRAVINNVDQMITPRAVKVVPAPEYGSVSDMLSKDMYKIAHRGGSVDFPEMSMYAYGQSALLGYSALEVSLSVSKDDVLFGLHDETLLRSSGVDLNPQTMTWAEIQSYASFEGTPYMRFEDLLMKYPDHIIFVDPKQIEGVRQYDVFDVMDSFGGPTRFVAKSFGLSVGWPARARERGYTSWGYFYTTNQSSFDVAVPRWDLLGMEYAATQSIWDEMLAYDKPVIGHICNNITAINSAISKGASGVMVSGVKAGASL